MKTIIRSRRAGAVLIGLAIAVVPAALAAPTFTPVGPPNTGVTGMTGDGSVLVGQQANGKYSYRWTREGRTENLGGGKTNPQDVQGDTSISRDGSTITAPVEIDGLVQAAIWRGGTDWEGLGGIGRSRGCQGFLSPPNGISGDGSVIVGLAWVGLSGCEFRAFRWDQDNGMVALEFTAAGGRADAASDDGSIIVGFDQAATGARKGARWVDGVLSLLEIPEPDHTFLGPANGVSRDGSAIVGSEATNPHRNLAYRWSEELGSEILGYLPNLVEQRSRSFANAVSADGRVVGGGSGPASFADRDAAVWTRASGMVKFQDYLAAMGVEGLLGWHLEGISAMSDDATTIAGFGTDSRLGPPIPRGWVVNGLPPFTDVNGDTILLGVNNCTRVANDNQSDTNGDGFGNLCDADFNGDCVVDGTDEAIMASKAGTPDADTDMNGDHITNQDDLALLQAGFGSPPGPSAIARCQAD